MKYLFLLTILISNSVFANDCFEFRGNRISKYLCTDKDVVIPKYINGSKVEVIGEYAFHKLGLNSVRLPNTIQRIENSSFSENDLSEVTIPSGIESIGGYAFSTNKIEKLMLPNTVKVIGYAAFSGNKIVNLDLPNRIEIISKHAFSLNKIKNLKLPISVKKIDQFAFIYNELEIVSLNRGLVEIGESSFAGCARLDDYHESCNSIRQLKLPSSLRKIEDNAFHYNFIANKIILPKSLESIGKNAFSTNEIPAVEFNEKLTSMNDGAFGYNKIEEIIFPKNIDFVANDLFKSNNLKKIELHSNVKTIGREAFAYNLLQGEIELPKSVETVYEDAFAKNGLRKLILNGKTHISSSFTDNPLDLVEAKEGSEARICTNIARRSDGGGMLPSTYILLGKSKLVRCEASIGIYSFELLNFYDEINQPSGVYRKKQSSYKWEFSHQ